MLTFLSQFFKTKFLSVITKVSLKDLEPIKDAITKKTKNLKVEVCSTKNLPEPQWQKWFPFSFFYGGGKFQPLYAWIFCFCLLSAGMLFVKVYAAWLAVKKGTYDSDMISTADIATVLTFISSLVLLYNTNRKNSQSSDSSGQ